uniref:Uncharacterized protein n=1 Tax=Brassica campestris TaxID=3711 RepID=A0A3P5ZF75_BRACM|nr:unnamed protein product [Brassica rapa]
MFLEETLLMVLETLLVDLMVIHLVALLVDLMVIRLMTLSSPSLLVVTCFSPACLVLLPRTLFCRSRPPPLGFYRESSSPATTTETTRWSVY